MRSSRIATVVAFTSSVTACDTVTLPPPRVDHLSLERSTVTLNAPDDVPVAELLGLRVDGERGAERQVRWSSSDSLAANVDDAGVLHVCRPSTNVTLTASAMHDATKRASAQATIGGAAQGFTSISALLDAKTMQPANIAELRGELTTGVTLAGTRIDCTGLARLELSVWDNGFKVVGSRSFTPRLRNDTTVTIPWSTAGLPNGENQLVLRAYLAGEVVSAIPVTLRVTIRN